MKVGRFRECAAIADEYRALAFADEEAARVLHLNSHYRQAMYFLVQAMEKHIRAKIFSLVNPDLEWVRESNRSHALENAIEFLLTLVASDPMLREQVRIQIYERVLGGIRFSQLHNNLRYPSYSFHKRSFAVLEVGDSDAKALASQLASLKAFLKDLDRLR